MCITTSTEHTVETFIRPIFLLFLFSRCRTAYLFEMSQGKFYQAQTSPPLEERNWEPSPNPASHPTTLWNPM